MFPPGGDANQPGYMTCTQRYEDLLKGVIYRASHTLPRFSVLTEHHGNDFSNEVRLFLDACVLELAPTNPHMATLQAQRHDSR